MRELTDDDQAVDWAELIPSEILEYAKNKSY